MDSAPSDGTKQASTPVPLKSSIGAQEYGGPRSGANVASSARASARDLHSHIFTPKRSGYACADQPRGESSTVHDLACPGNAADEGPGTDRGSSDQSDEACARAVTPESVSFRENNEVVANEPRSDVMCINPSNEADVATNAIELAPFVTATPKVIVGGTHVPVPPSRHMPSAPYILSETSAYTPVGSTPREPNRAANVICMVASSRPVSGVSSTSDDRPPEDSPPSPNDTAPSKDRADRTESMSWADPLARSAAKPSGPTPPSVEERTSSVSLVSAGPATETASCILLSVPALRARETQMIEKPSAKASPQYQLMPSEQIGSKEGNGVLATASAEASKDSPELGPAPSGSWSFPKIRRYSGAGKSEPDESDRHQVSTHASGGQQHRRASLDHSDSDSSYLAPKHKQLPKVAQERPPYCRIFVGNLATEFTTVAELASIFERYGPLIEEPVLRRSFGFVQYGCPEHANAAVSAEQGRLIGGIALDLKIADNRDVRKGAHIVNNTPYSHGSRGQIMAAAAAAGATPPPGMPSSPGNRGLLGTCLTSSRKRRRDRSPLRRAYFSRRESGLVRGSTGSELHRGSGQSSHLGRMRPPCRGDLYVRILCIAPQARSYAHHCEGLFREATVFTVDVFHIVASSLGESLGRALQQAIPYVVVVASKDMDGGTCTIRTLEETGYEKAGAGNGVIPVQEAIGICLTDQGLARARSFDAVHCPGLAMGGNVLIGNDSMGGNVGSGVGSIHMRGGQNPGSMPMYYGGTNMPSDGAKMNLTGENVCNTDITGGGAGATSPLRNSQTRGEMSAIGVGMRGEQAGAMISGMRQPMYSNWGGGLVGGQMVNCGVAIPMQMNNISGSVLRTGMEFEMENPVANQVRMGMNQLLVGPNTCQATESGYGSGFSVNSGVPMPAFSRSFPGNIRVDSVGEPGWMRGASRNVNAGGVGGRTSKGLEYPRSGHGPNIPLSTGHPGGFAGYDPDSESGKTRYQKCGPQNNSSVRPIADDVLILAADDGRAPYSSQICGGGACVQGPFSDNSQGRYGPVGCPRTQRHVQDKYVDTYVGAGNQNRQDLLVEDRAPMAQHGYGYGVGYTAQLQQQDASRMLLGRNSSRGQHSYGDNVGERLHAKESSMGAWHSRISGSQNEVAWSESCCAPVGMPRGILMDEHGRQFQGLRRLGAESQSGSSGCGSRPGPRNSWAGGMVAGDGQLSLAGAPGGVDMGTISSLISAFQQRAQQGGGNMHVSAAMGLSSMPVQYQHGIMNVPSFMGQPYESGPSQQFEGVSMGGIGHGSQLGDEQDGIQGLLANPVLQRALQNINQVNQDGVRHLRNQQPRAQYQEPYHLPGDSSQQRH